MKYADEYNEVFDTGDDYPEYANIPINVYDIDAMVAAETDGQFESHDYSGGAAIIIRKDGSGCMVDYEAVGYEFRSIDDETQIGIHKLPEQHEGYKTISIVATHRIECTYREIIDTAPVRQMTVDEFFTKRNYNDRCARNFAGIIEFLEDSF